MPGMAVMKGILDVVTILPDSIGWNQCLTRKSKNHLAY